MASDVDIIEDISRIAAKLIAVEAVVVQITSPLLEAVEPGLGRELIDTIRAGLNLPLRDDVQQLAVEEYLQRFADDIEARVRAKIAAER